MSDLATSLRTTIDDRAAPITLDEVRIPRAVRRRRRSVGRLVVPAVAALGVVVAVVVVSALRHDDGSIGDRVATTRPPSEAACTTDFVLRCPAGPRQATKLLGVPIESPHSLPDGWKRWQRVVHEFPPGYADGPDLAIRLFRRSWSLDGRAPDPDVPYLVLNQRPALEFELGEPQGTDLVLADGTPAFGNPSGNINWVRDGVWYSVLAVGIEPEAVMSFVNSIR